MGKAVHQIELLNTARKPASEGALVDALLGFASGADIVIVSEAGKTQVDLSEERKQRRLRARFAAVLASLTDVPALIKRPFRGSSRAALEMSAREEDEARAALQQAYQASDEGTNEELQKLEAAGNAWDSVAESVLRLQASLQVHPVIDFKPTGAAVRYLPRFRNVESVLTFALLLVMDDTRPYGKVLAHCKLPSCSKFYLAKKNPDGGPPNRTYCRPKHRELHHNSKERRAASKARAKARRDT